MLKFIFKIRTCIYMYNFPQILSKSTINIDGSFTIHSHNTYINTLKKKLYTFCNNECKVGNDFKKQWISRLMWFCMPITINTKYSVFKFFDWPWIMHVRQPEMFINNILIWSFLFQSSLHVCLFLIWMNLISKDSESIGFFSFLAE